MGMDFPLAIIIIIQVKIKSREKPGAHLLCVPSPRGSGRAESGTGGKEPDETTFSENHRMIWVGRDL